MNWLSNLTPPGLKGVFGRRDSPDNLWIKCPKSGELVYRQDLEAAQWVTPAGAHMRIGWQARFNHLLDDENYQQIDMPDVARDPLKFKDDKKYSDRIKAARGKTGMDDCVAAAYGAIGGNPTILLVQDFAFMGGSLGMWAGEAFITAVHEAIAREAAFVAVIASGGARMQEGTLSLMQMPRTTLALQELKGAGLPYIVILTDPTSGGVSASYAMLGDVHIAEPGALVAFTGPRVIEQTIRQKLPPGFQRSEFLKEKGMVDIVCDRREFKPLLEKILNHLLPDSARLDFSIGQAPSLAHPIEEDEV